MKFLVATKPHPITKILAWDLEWSLTKDEYGEYPILAAGFCDSQGYSQAFLLEDFLSRRENRKDAEKALLFKITSILNKYDWSVGFYSTGVRAFNPAKHRMMGRNSDLIQLHTRLKRYELESPIFISDKNKLPYLVGKTRNHTHIDAYNLFVNKVIRASLYNNAYNAFDLDTISRIILGEKIGGKFEGLSGPIFESLINLDEKRNYVLLDAKLLINCIAHNNYELLRIMNSMAQLTGMPFRNICNSKGVTKIWTPIIDKLVATELSQIDGVNGGDEDVLRYDALSNYYIKKQKWIDPSNELYDEPEIVEIEGENGGDDERLTEKNKKARYIGGWMFENIVKGEYKDVKVFDITSLYPTMIVNNNISFETINCPCCFDAEVPDEIFEGKKSNVHICIKHKGILTKQISEYMTKRIEYKRLAKQSVENEYENISNTYKILINSAYGQLGHKFSKYENVMAAELVTRFGRATIKHCVKIATEVFKWNVIYGDTDSIFINNGESISKNDIKQFMELCKKGAHVNIELEKEYKKLLIIGGKNYVGVLKDSKKLVAKGVSGKKADRCLWVRNAFKQLLEDYKNDVNPCINLRSELDKLIFGKLERPEHQLIMFKQLGMNVDEYKVNNVQKLAGQEQQLETGDTVRYYSADRTDQNGQKQYTYDVNEISLKSYRNQLINTMKPILRLLGYDEKKEFASADNKIKSIIHQQRKIAPSRAIIAPKVSLKNTLKNLKPKTEIEKYQLVQLK